MERTLLVKINIPDISQLPQEAEDVFDDLLKAGHDVLSVEPWAGSVSAPIQFGGLNLPPTGSSPNPPQVG